MVDGELYRRWQQRVINVMRLFSCSFLLLFVLAASARAQPSPSPSPASAGTAQRQTPAASQSVEEVGEGDVLRISANLVSVPVSVINRRGQYVVDLLQKDFRVYEDGVEQPIVHFSNVDQPFSVILLIDTSGSTQPFIDQIKGAAKAFVGQLRPADKVQPVYFHGEIKTLIATSSNDSGILAAAIDQIRAGPLNMGTRLYDAVDFALGSLRSVSGRKAVILFTDGDDTWSKARMKTTLHDAEESDIVIYTLQYGDAPAQKYLQQLAEKTGGRYFMAGDANTTTRSFAEVAEELRRQYVLGYHPNELTPRGQPRRIVVKVNRPHMAVRARRSYTYNR